MFDSIHATELAIFMYGRDTEILWIEAGIGDWWAEHSLQKEVQHCRKSEVPGLGPSSAYFIGAI
jgi:hypothetical protein